MLSATLADRPPGRPAPSLVESTLDAAARFAAAGTITISTSVQSLTQGVLRTMLLNKIKAISLVLVVVSVATGGVAWTIRSSGAANPPGPPQAQATPSQVEKKAERPIEKNPSITPGGSGARGRPGREPIRGPGLGTSFPFAPTGKNAPNMVDPANPLPIYRTPSILIVESPDRRAIQAMSLEAGDQDEAVWHKLTLPPGVTANPHWVNDTVALVLKGKTIDQVAAFSRHTGEWKVQRLLKPAQDELTPLVSVGLAVYQVGNDIYAFSEQTGTWGVLHLEGEEKPGV